MKLTGMQPSTCYATSREQEATLYSCIHYTGPEFLALKIYSDTNWAGDKADCKSVSSYLGVLAGGPIFWYSKKQNGVATSSCEAELIALSRATGQASTCAASFNPCIFQQTQPKSSLTVRVQWLLYPVRSKVINQS